MAAKETVKLGKGLCVSRKCSSKEAAFTLSKSGLAVCTCNACNSQHFARSARSDQDFRDCIIPPDTSPPAAPAPEPAPPAPSPAPTPKKTIGWGIFAGREES